MVDNGIDLKRACVSKSGSVFLFFQLNGFNLGSRCRTASILAKDLSKHSDPLTTSPNSFLAFATFVQVLMLSRPW